jgi:hypothetical protein
MGFEPITAVQGLMQFLVLTKNMRLYYVCYNSYTYHIIVLKVRFILLWLLFFFDLGKICIQLACVASFITSKLPCSRTS